MEKQSKLSLVGLIVVILVLIFLFMIIIPGLQMVERLSQKSICGFNLKAIGKTMTVYANDYDNSYPQLPGNGDWSKELGFSYFLKKPDFQTKQADTPRTISSSLYLLINKGDLSPKSFICPWADQTEFEGRNPESLDIVDLWDFGNDPYKHISYSYHNPYGNFPPDASRSAAFAVVADMNPWFKYGNIIPPGKDNLPPQIITIPPQWLEVKPWQTDDPSLQRLQYQALRKLWEPSNSLNKLSAYRGPLGNKDKYGGGQYVLFSDGHISYDNQPNVGVNGDNIYTFWSTEDNPIKQDTQGGTAPTSRSGENDAKSTNDSFLAI